MDPIRNRNILVYGALSGSSIAWVVKITRQDVVVTLVIILLFLMHNTSRHYKISKSVRKHYFRKLHRMKKNHILLYGDLRNEIIQY